MIMVMKMILMMIFSAQKTAATAITRGASVVIIVFLSVTVGIFLVFRIFDPARVIQMCEELTLLCAHICLMPTDLPDQPDTCRVVSILIHYFFTACFTFMLLEGDTTLVVPRALSV